MTEITHMAYARVAADATPSYPTLRPIDAGVSNFLGDHMRDLRRLADARQTLPGRFAEQEAQLLFRSLFSGTDEEFLAAADTLTKRLLEHMDQRTASGLLVCLRATDMNDTIAGVLKLQVVAEHAAVLESLDSGEEVLSAVSNLLDKPGELQKGALMASSIAEDRVIVGDRLGHDAAYFPRAFGIRIYSRPSEAVGVLLDTIEAVSPEFTEHVAAALPGIEPGEPLAVLNELGQRIPDLTDELQSIVLEELGQLPRPVGYIDTRRRGVETVTIGRITVSGPISEMHQHVSIQELPNGRWQVTVGGDEPPKRRHR